MGCSGWCWEREGSPKWQRFAHTSTNPEHRNVLPHQGQRRHGRQGLTAVHAVGDGLHHVAAVVAVVRAVTPDGRGARAGLGTRAGCSALVGHVSEDGPGPVAEGGLDEGRGVDGDAGTRAVQDAVDGRLADAGSGGQGGDGHAAGRAAVHGGVQPVREDRQMADEGRLGDERGRDRVDLGDGGSGHSNGDGHGVSR